MKTKSATIVFYVALVFLYAPATVFAQSWHMVRWVIDGDTVVLKNGSIVRYIGINAPEIAHENKKGEPFGIFSTRINRKLVQGRKIRLKTDHETKDRYGRQLAYVFLADGTFVNAVLLRLGAAYCLPRSLNTEYKHTFQKEQQRAMATGRGIWQNWTKRAEKLLGNKKSYRFHRQTCPFGKKIKNRNRVYFPNRWEAFEAGFAPCKKCIKQFRD